MKDVKRIIAQNVLQQWQTRWEDKEKQFKLEKRVLIKSKMCLEEEGDFDL